MKKVILILTVIVISLLTSISCEKSTNKTNDVLDLWSLDNPDAHYAMWNGKPYPIIDFLRSPDGSGLIVQRNNGKVLETIKAGQTIEEVCGKSGYGLSCTCNCCPTGFSTYWKCDPCVNCCINPQHKLGHPFFWGGGCSCGQCITVNLEE